MSEAGDSRSERRSSRRHAERRRKAGRLFLVVAPAAALILVLAVLFPLLISPGQQGEGASGDRAASVATSLATGTATTAGTAAPGGSGSSPASPPGSALLVIEQDGAPAAVALVFAGPKGGLVLALPGVTLLRSGDRFAQIARLYGRDNPRALAQPLADVLAVPVGSVASVEWSDLRGALANEGIDPPPSGPVDPKAVEAEWVANALAAILSASDTNGSEHGWGEGRLSGDVEGFGEAVHAALLAAQGNAWTGQAVTGSLVENGDATYLEPDIKTARSVLAETGAGG